MSNREPSISELSARLNDVVAAVRWLILLLIVLLSLSNFVMSFMIERTQEATIDELPGKPLPALMEGLFSHATFLHYLAVAWPVLAIVNAVVNKHLRSWAFASVVLLFAIGLQMVITCLVCSMPTVIPATSMSDQAAPR